MSCNCHGKEGKGVRTTSVYDQCTMCARKHVNNAWGAYNEFTYEDDNRDYVSDQLRKAADHLKFDHRDVALICRDLAVAIETNRDKEYNSLADEINNIRITVRDLFYKDHPDAKERLNDIKSRTKNSGNL